MGNWSSDREVAAHYGVQIETVQGDMRDLSGFETATFDLVAARLLHQFCAGCAPGVCAGGAGD